MFCLGLSIARCYCCVMCLGSLPGRHWPLVPRPGHLTATPWCNTQPAPGFFVTVAAFQLTVCTNITINHDVRAIFCVLFSGGEDCATVQSTVPPAVMPKTGLSMSQEYSCLCRNNPVQTGKGLFDIMEVQLHNSIIDAFLLTFDIVETILNDIIYSILNNTCLSPSSQQLNYLNPHHQSSIYKNGTLPLESVEPPPNNHKLVQRHFWLL